VAATSWRFRVNNLEWLAAAASHEPRLLPHLCHRQLAPRKVVGHCRKIEGGKLRRGTKLHAIANP
jgi:hypothetical protein